MALSGTVYGIFLTATCLLNLVSVIHCTATWDQGDVELHQGEDLSITCTVTGMDAMGILRVEQTRDGKTTTITDNDAIKSMYSATGRYSIEAWDLDVPKQKGVLTLKYTGIRGEDEGTISCFGRGDVESTAYINIKVLVPVKDVYMIAVMGPGNEIKEADGATISLKEEQEMGFICVAVIDGSNGSPEMQIVIDGEDKTAMFERTESPLPDPSSRKRRQGNHELVTRQNEVRLSYVTMNPDYNFNEKEMTCTATNPATPSKSTTVYLDVEFRPVVQCSKYKYHAQLGTTVVMTCDVWANPGPTISWSHGDDSEGALVIDPIKTEGTLSLSEDTESEDHVIVSLTISDVNDSHFTSYYLDASNDIGKDDVTLSLEEGAEPTDPPGKPGNEQNKHPPTTKEPASPPNPQGVRGGDDSGATTCTTTTLTVLVSICLTCLLNLPLVKLL